MAVCGNPAFKIILCGDYGVGKSSLFRRFTSNTFIEGSVRESALGLDHYAQTFSVTSKDDFKVQLWDTGGMERVATVTSSYYKFSDAAILTYSAEDLESFNNLSQHILEIVSYAENAKIFLCGNKADLHEYVTDSQINEFKEQCQDLIVKSYKVSCKSGVRVHEMFQDVAETLSRENRQRIDPDAFKVAPPVEPKSKCGCGTG
ncbi:PREDICTED: GTP-binding protein ypt1-like [Priapulus caudatus]|uniref:GTP-binding protein ypt1-like n=1 Tax=Priapulus caudatus TaxID=37621 RepID=A0ABM1E459_PRICU|nr:PREDICTED: GTP-binding protein ypt1-like [Priapulus caudatus]XP_014666981.1 PREDICTED: GTP-binding protein ypt1-like [Priapulus caudatus]